MEANIQTQHKARWFASLSNGENATENKGRFQDVSGELSPWNKLLAYLKENDLKITGMQIRMEGKVFNLPSQAEKTRIFSERPLSYNYFRFWSGDIGPKGKPDELYIVVEAIFTYYRLQLWVNELTGNESWISIISNNE